MLIDPILPAELEPAVRVRLQDWADWARTPDDPDWRLPRSHKAYAVETMCRGLHTLACGASSSKRQAVAWALENIPEPWRSTVRRSQAWRTDNTYDPDIIPEVRQFVLWAASYQPAAAPDRGYPRCEPRGCAAHAEATHSSVSGDAAQ